jgi:hypothetical protein
MSAKIDNDKRAQSRLDEVRCDIVSRAILWRICSDPCAKQCSRARRCIGNRERCIERLFPTYDEGHLRWHLRDAATLDDDDSGWSVRSSAELAAEYLQKDGMTIPEGQTRKVENIIAAYRKACDDYRG